MIYLTGIRNDVKLLFDEFPISYLPYNTSEKQISKVRYSEW